MGVESIGKDAFDTEESFEAILMGLSSRLSNFQLLEKKSRSFAESAGND